MTPYKGKVHTTLYGYPICFQDWKYCNVKQCYYHISLSEFGNCLLRVDRGHTLEEIGVVLGVRKQRVWVIMNKLIEKCTGVLTEG